MAASIAVSVYGAVKYKTPAAISIAQMIADIAFNI
jgi:hypothetical protein